jgi:hypothetical protein
MLDRFLVWLGAAMVTAGVTAAMVAGAGIAAADSPPGSDANGTTSSESAKPTENKPDSDKDGTPKPKPKPAGKKPGKQSADDPTEPTAAVGKDPAPASATTTKTTEKPVRPVKTDRKPVAKPVVKQAAVEPAPQDAAKKTLQTAVAATAPTSLTAKIAAPNATVAPPETAAVAFAAAAPATETTSTAAAPRIPPLLSFIGTIFFNLFSFATRLFEGPPVLPPGSTVTVRSSTLQLPCASAACTVPADWYFPTDAEPTGLTYLQHGFLAGGRFYSFTAATLAEETHSIVVAPTLTSNFFATDGYWLGGTPMHQAVANLFIGPRTALTDSASAAMGTEVTLPQRVVLVGHSLGGGLVTDAAGYMVDNHTIGDLAGVVLLDGVTLDDAQASAALAKVPDALPIYQIASPPYFWNQWDGLGVALVAKRPGRFNGVQLVGGAHIDSMQGGNPLIQFGAYLVAGASQTQNIEAVKQLAAGWINDMFAGTHTGIYGTPGASIDIPTDAGHATAIALPAPATPLSTLDLLLQWLSAFGDQFFFKSPPAADPATASLAA